MIGSGSGRLAFAKSLCFLAKVLQFRGRGQSKRSFGFAVLLRGLLHLGRQTESDAVPYPSSFVPNEADCPLPHSCFISLNYAIAVAKVPADFASVNGRSRIVMVSGESCNKV